MDFGKTLSRSWDIIWKNKVLWIFGILASCGSQGRSSSSFNFSFNTDSFNGPPGQMPPAIEQFFFNLQHRLDRIGPETLFAISATVIVFAIFVSLVIFLLSVYGRMGLIKGVIEAGAGQPLSLGQVNTYGVAFFTRGLGLNLLLGLLVFAVGAIFALLAIAVSVFTLGIGLICILPLLCLLVPLGIAYGVYVELANIALVSEDLGIRDALRRGWEVMRDNLANIAVMGLILIIGGGLINFLFGLPIGLVAVPALIGYFAGDGAQFWNGLAITGICLALFIPVAIVLAGILRTYVVTAWTLTYQELAASKTKAKKA